jgi:hypothetical protein
VKAINETVIMVDFNTHSREIEEVYEVSPDGRQVRTDEGWVSSFRPDVITQRPIYVPGFLTPDSGKL